MLCSIFNIIIIWNVPEAVIFGTYIGEIFFLASDMYPLFFMSYIPK